MSEVSKRRVVEGDGEEGRDQITQSILLTTMRDLYLILFDEKPFKGFVQEQKYLQDHSGHAQSLGVQRVEEGR